MARNIDQPQRIFARRKTPLGGGCLLAAWMVLPGWAAKPTPVDVMELDSIEVRGDRDSLENARDIKRVSPDIVDSVVAADLHAFPDLSVTEALQRITGVQISRDRGEGGSVSLRGLSQMETTLNGREVFSAGGGRNLDFTLLPAELLAGIDVYKTSAAERLEGGVGGSIDLRTHHPFDFSGQRVAVSAGALRGDLVDAGRGQFALLASNRWRLAGGEFGALVNVAAQGRAWREDQKSTGAPIARADILPGQTVYAPGSDTETASGGDRDRLGLDLALQWRPNTALELYAEANYAHLSTRQNSYQINLATAGAGFVPGSPVLYDGTQDLKSITWTDVPVSILSFSRDTEERTRQAALGGIWKNGDGRVQLDLSHTDSRQSLYFAGPILAGTAAYFHQDLGDGEPVTAVDGTDFSDPANLRFVGMAYRTRPFQGRLDAIRLDGEQALALGPIERLSVGTRLARRRADNAPGLIYADAAANVPAEALREYLLSNPYSCYSGASSLCGYLVGNPDIPALRDLLGITAPIPTSNPLGTWDIREDTLASYVMAHFHAEAPSLDGNVGLRLTATRENVAGYQSVPSSGDIVPLHREHRYLDLLPSLNLRRDLGDGLLARAALAKSMTRPDFSQLSPSLILLANSIDPSLNQGSAGNPDLKPVRADNLDLALERHFGRSGMLHATGFLKRVEGFVGTLSFPEVHDGAVYQVTRPYNTGSARIAGAELGYQQFYDMLPGWLGGLGLQANYTYIDSRTPSTVLGRDVPLQGLSRHGYNLVGMYEKGRLGARLAYNWRDTYLSGITQIVGLGPQPIYTQAHGWLDAALRYRIDKAMTLSLTGNNLLKTRRQSYYGVDTRPQSTWINDRQFGLSLSAQL